MEMQMQKIEVIDRLVQQVAELNPLDENALDAARCQAEMIVRNLFGEQSKYLSDLGRIRYHPQVWRRKPTAEESRNAWDEGVAKLLNTINTMREEVLLFDKPSPPLPIQKQSIGNQIFVVHGHDQAMKEAVARTLEKVGLHPIILHEQPDKGKTVIEKFTDIADVGFAVVLLSPDDVGYERGFSPECRSFRARQNVVFELGYFIGRLGRERVLALRRKEGDFGEKGDFEMPSDYSGVLYVPFDDGEQWRLKLVHELKEAGYDVDTNRLIG